MKVNYIYNLFLVNMQFPSFLLIVIKNPLDDEYKQMLKAIISVFLLAVLTTPLKFLINVHQAQGAKCFYQTLTANEKYFFQVITRTHQSYRMDVMRSEGNRWEEILMKVADGVVESVSKYAPTTGTYMFCLSNSDENNVLRARVEIMSGLEMVNLDYLPSNNDQENLHKEIDWLQKQKSKIFDVITRHENNRATAADLTSTMSIKYVILAVVGLVSVVAVNTAFYFQTKKTLKDRKLI